MPGLVLDTSAILAVLFREPEAEAFLEQTAGTEDSVLISAATLMECRVVLARAGRPDLSGPLDDLLSALGVTVSAFTAVQADLGAEAYARYGRGSGHPASLNFGDCFSYALAKEKGLPLLYKGDDFGRTDLA